MPKGVVQFFLEKKGYGYIRIPETREEFYVQKKQLLEPVKKGDRVSFEIKESKQGLYATKVCLEKP
jgi:cold shock CspA family protein